MRKSRFTDEQIISILKQSDAAPRRKSSAQTRHQSHILCGGKRFAKIDVPEARQLRRPKHLVAELTLDKQALEVMLGEKRYDEGIQEPGATKGWTG